VNIFDFQCRCGKCQDVQPDMTLVVLIHDLELHFRKELHITSGYRCPSHSVHVGSTATSQHCKATAVDCYVPGVEYEVLHDWLCHTYPNTLGIGIYNSHVHIDSRVAPARWDSRT
jgi:zinc D-Ala-D-Ala carboxypeptidase